MTAIKVCGLTRAEDVALACAEGVSWLGFNFSSASPRRVSAETAREIAAAATPGVLRVGVFVEETWDAISDAARRVPLDLVQIHRPLKSGDVAKSPVPLIAVAHVGEGGPHLPEIGLLGRCRALLFDRLERGRAGGTGLAFDWGVIVDRTFPVAVLVAGGMNADNVAEAIARVRPWGVDVTSGIESAPGRKDPEKMRRFVEAVRRADAAAA